MNLFWSIDCCSQLENTSDIWITTSDCQLTRLWDCVKLLEQQLVDEVSSFFDVFSVKHKIVEFDFLRRLICCSLVSCRLFALDLESDVSHQIHQNVELLCHSVDLLSS